MGKREVEDACSVHRMAGPQWALSWDRGAEAAEIIRVPGYEQAVNRADRTEREGGRRHEEQEKG
mgnify:CR=1 FL=1